MDDSEPSADVNEPTTYLRNIPEWARYRHRMVFIEQGGRGAG